MGHLPLKQTLAALAGLALCTSLVLLHVPAASVLPFFSLSLGATLAMDAALSAILNGTAIALCGVLLRYVPQTPRPIASTIIFTVLAWYLGTMIVVWLLTQRLRRRIRDAARRAENVLPQLHAPGITHLYARLVDLAPNAVIVTDSSGAIVLWNQMAQQLFGYTRDEILGQTVETLVPTDLIERHTRHRIAYMHHPQTRPMGIGLDLQARHKDGTLFPVEISLAPIDKDAAEERERTGELGDRDGDGGDGRDGGGGGGRSDGGHRSLLIKTTVHPIAQRLALEKEVRDAHAARQVAQAQHQSAEAALRERDLFLTTITHELRTPLTSIAGLVEHLSAALILSPSPLPQDQRLRIEKALGFLSAQTARLVRLLNIALEMARMHNHRFVLHKSTIDLVPLVQDQIALIQSSTCLHTLLLDAPQGTCLLWADPLRLEQVVSNLLDNAVKFSPEGGRIIVALRRAEHRSQGWVRLSVRDHGLGIPPDKRADIFTAFFQAHSENFRSGLGLGLHLCKEIVEAHGGRMRAEFPGDGGTRIILMLPTRGD